MQLSIKEILNSDRNFAVLSDYFAPQERDRLVAILEQALVNIVDQTDTTKNYEEWARVAKISVIKELQEASGYFGFKDIVNKINIESLLKQYYNSNISGVT